jgi:hypothetical protein
MQKIRITTGVVKEFPGGYFTAIQARIPDHWHWGEEERITVSFSLSLRFSEKII